MTAESSEKRTLSGLAAAADLSAKRYHIVRLVSATTCNQASNAADTLLGGVIENAPAANQAVTIVNAGMVPVTVGGSLGFGAQFTTNGSGRAVAATSGQYIIGTILEAASADGDIVTAWLRDPYKFAG